MDHPITTLATDPVFSKSSSHDGKKPFTEVEAAEICSRKPWYGSYRCQYCEHYHLTQTMKPKKYFQQKSVGSAVGTFREDVDTLLAGMMREYANMPLDNRPNAFDYLWQAREKISELEKLSEEAA